MNKSQPRFHPEETSLQPGINLHLNFGMDSSQSQSNQQSKFIASNSRIQNEVAYERSAFEDSPIQTQSKTTHQMKRGILLNKSIASSECVQKNQERERQTSNQSAQLLFDHFDDEYLKIEDQILNGILSKAGIKAKVFLNIRDRLQDTLQQISKSSGINLEAMNATQVIKLLDMRVFKFMSQNSFQIPKFCIHEDVCQKAVRLFLLLIREPRIVVGKPNLQQRESSIAHFLKTYFANEESKWMTTFKKQLRFMKTIFKSNYDFQSTPIIKMDSTLSRQCCGVLIEIDCTLEFANHAALTFFALNNRDQALKNLQVVAFSLDMAFANQFEMGNQLHLQDQSEESKNQESFIPKSQPKIKGPKSKPKGSRGKQKSASKPKRNLKSQMNSSPDLIMLEEKQSQTTPSLKNPLYSISERINLENQPQTLQIVQFQNVESNHKQRIRSRNSISTIRSPNQFNLGNQPASNFNNFGIPYNFGNLQPGIDNSLEVNVSNSLSPVSLFLGKKRTSQYFGNQMQSDEINEPNLKRQNVFNGFNQSQSQNQQPFTGMRK